MTKTHERGRLTDDEYDAYAAQTLTFDRKEATFTEKQCLDWVKAMAPKPEPEAPPDMEDVGGESEGALPGSKRLKKLFTTRRTPAAGKAAGPGKTPGLVKTAGGKSVAARAQQ